MNGYQPEDIVRESYAEAPSGDALGGMIAGDVATLLPDDYLVKVDRASMAHGLEVRPPLLDHELLQLAAQIPSQLKVHKGESKWILKEAYRQRLPNCVLYRRKQGFEMPIDAWLRGPLQEMFEAAVLERGARVGPLVDQNRIRRLYRAHVKGTGRHGAVLWMLLVLARWADRYLPGAA